MAVGKAARNSGTERKSGRRGEGDEAVGWLPRRAISKGGRGEGHSVI